LSDNTKLVYNKKEQRGSTMCESSFFLFYGKVRSIHKLIIDD